MTKQKHRKNNPNSEFCKTYYKIRFPEMSDEEIDKKIKWLRKSINYRAIEFYEKKYPELTHEEHLKMKSEAIRKTRGNNPSKIEYYQKNYPNFTKEEQEKLWHDYNKKHNYCNVEFYLNKGYSKEEAIELRNKKVIETSNKISSKVSGKNNGMHRSNRSQRELEENCPWHIEFYNKRYPELSIEERERLRQQTIKKTQSRIISHNTQIEYYIRQGFTKEEAEEKLKDRQNTSSLDKFIKRYGENEGRKRFLERQTRWKSSLQKSFNHSGTPYTQSQIALKMLTDLCNRLSIDMPKMELCLINENRNKIKSHYFYDFNYKDKIIEFNGDYWHCNPKTWSKDKYNKSLHLTAQEVWNKDADKKKCAESHGYKVLSVWDSEYKKDPLMVMKKCIDFINS